MAVNEATTAYGRVAMIYESSIESKSTVSCNLTLPAAWGGSSGARRGIGKGGHSSGRDDGAGSPPGGGVVIRFRVPNSKKIKKVTVGGLAWSHFDALQETITVTAEQLSAKGMLESLQNVVATFE